MVFRVALLNLHQGFTRWTERRELIVEQLGKLRPDILALNEISVPLQTGRWLQGEANERFRLQYALVQQTKSGYWSEDEAQGLLTCFPIVETGNLDYLSRGRVAQVVRIDVEGHQVDVYVTHLHHVPEEDGLRQYQVRRLFQWIESRDNVSGCIVCGDFNATSDSPSVRLIPASFRPVQIAPTFPTGLRAPGRPPLESHVEPLSFCFDYIWIAGNLESREAGRCFDQPESDDPTLWPSDHVGVWADLTLKLSALSSPA
jgi:endonuclease/exonuclease/phosphatase family metal-dependent hydrolase